MKMFHISNIKVDFFTTLCLIDNIVHDLMILIWSDWFLCGFVLRVSVLIQSLTLGVSFPSLLYFLYIFWFPCFVSLRNRSACSVEQMNQTKSSLIVAQIYTQHTWGKRECKDLGPNRTTVAEHKGKARWVSVWNIWARRVQEGEGVKTKPACSPQANIVYIAVHANSMNILSHYFFALLV